jgi:hypothetical protein
MTDRIWAFAVLPARMLPPEVVTGPRGGRVPITTDLREALQSAIERTREGAWTSVVFRVEQINDARGRRRSSESRDAFMTLAFGDDAEADAAAATLAGRLAAAMDRRSPTNLLVLGGSLEDAIASVRVWTFPRDDAFRFNEAAAPTIELLADVFSRTSGLRKAARFDGENHDGSFIGGDALDFQTGSNSFEVANYWIGRFLGSQLGVTPTVGTQLVALALRKLDEQLVVSEERQTLTVAAMALRASPRTNWTLQDIADTFLPEELRGRLLDASSKPEMNQAPFQLNHDLFDSMVATRVFSLESGVVVTSPISQVGDADDPTKSVVVTGDQLRCEGTVAKEKLRGRSRGQAA